MKKFFTLILVLVGICSAQAALIDFETANTDWQFVHTGQANYWTIGTAAGSAAGGSKAMYVTSGGGYAYNESSTSVSWACIPVIVNSQEAISFDWKGATESCCDYVRVYLFPSYQLPTAGSNANGVSGVISLSGNLTTASSWQNCAGRK